MKRFLLLLIMSCALSLWAQEADDEMSPEDIALFEEFAADSIRGRCGAVHLAEAHCTLNVPDGFVFLDPESALHLLVDYWDNSRTQLSSILGALVPADAGIYYNVETAYVIDYSDAGYVSDDDAGSIDFDELLKSMQKDIEEENKKNPSDTQWELLDWPWPPSYDSDRKVLSWARHYRIDGGDHENLNYDVRVLGKDGFVIITAVANPEEKEQLLADNRAIINSVSYDEGYKYSDFDPDTDNVAAWTIGGLVAGKVLAKAGIWAFLAKFAKVIIVGLIAALAAMRKRIAGWLGLGKE